MSQGILWPDAFVGPLAAGGRRVIRYDHRDTGMSGTVDFATDPYTWDEIKNDVYRVLAAHGLDSAHLVGHSAGGLLGQLIASSPLGGEGQVLLRALMGQPQPQGGLPEPEPEFVEFFRAPMAAPPDRDHRALIDSMIAEQRVLHGTGPLVHTTQHG